jgi:hypothetical protein
MPRHHLLRPLPKPLAAPVAPQRPLRQRAEASLHTMSGENGAPRVAAHRRFPKPPAADKPSAPPDKRGAALHVSFSGDDASLHSALAQVAAHLAELQLARLGIVRSRMHAVLTRTPCVHAQAESQIRRELEERSRVADLLQAKEQLSAELAAERGRVREAEAAAARLATERQVRQARRRRQQRCANPNVRCAGLSALSPTGDHGRDRGVEA